MTSEYRKSRKPFCPVVGEWYTNEGGGVYACRESYRDGSAKMQSVSSGWMLIAHGLGIYSDGKIDWDYSTGLGFYGYPV